MTMEKDSFHYLLRLKNRLNENEPVRCVLLFFNVFFHVAARDDMVN